MSRGATPPERAWSAAASSARDDLLDGRGIGGVRAHAPELERVGVGDERGPEPQRIADEPRRRAGACPRWLLGLPAADPAPRTGEPAPPDLAAVRLAMIAAGHTPPKPYTRRGPVR